jgi:hypothetical protein
MFDETFKSPVTEQRDCGQDAISFEDCPVVLAKHEKSSKPEIDAFAKLTRANGLSEEEQFIMKRVYQQLLSGRHITNPSCFGDELRQAVDRLYQFNPGGLNDLLTALRKSGNAKYFEFATRMQNECGDDELRAFGQKAGLQPRQVRALYHLGLRVENLNAYPALNAWGNLKADTGLLTKELTKEQRRQVIDFCKTSKNGDRHLMLLLFD